MDALFDGLSRIVSTPMSRRSTLRLIFAAIAVQTFGRPTEVRGAHRMWPLTKMQKRKTLNAAETASRLRLAYLARNNYAYRTELFAAFSLLRGIDGTQLQNILNGLVADIQKNGADGLETLVLACVDAIGTKTQKAPLSPAAVAQLRASVKALDRGLHFWSAATPPNMRIPLGRVSSPLVLDIRADAARTLLQQLALLNRGSKDVQTIIDLLDENGVQGALCPPSLPTQQDQDDELSAADKSRTANCDAHGSAGAIDGGTVKGSLGDLTLSGCLQLPPTAIATLTARLQAMDKCLDKVIPQRQNVELTATQVGIALGIVGIVVTVGGLVYQSMDQTKRDAVAQIVADGAAVIDAHKELNKLSIAETAAQDVANIAKNAVSTAEANLTKAKNNETSAAANGDGQDQANAHIDTVAAQAALDAAKVNLAEAQTKADAAKTLADNAKKEVMQTTRTLVDDTQKLKGDLSPDDPFNSPDCREAFGYFADRATREKLGKDWQDWKSRLGRVSNPSPESSGSPPAGESPYDALELAMCGADDATSNNRAAGCKMPVDCVQETMPDENCGCKGTPTDQARLFANIAAAACSNVHCADTARSDAVSSDSSGGTGASAVGRGMVCACVETNKEGNMPPSRPPIPSIVATLFGNGKTPAIGADTPSAHVLGMLFKDLSNNRFL
jgi:hypothetical protein